ncbi:MAG: hypothetical protein Q9157_007018 [Trypethelium eluteriae]
MTISLTASPPAAPYMTLSHCWGALKTIKLLKNNVRDFCSGLPVDGLPATYKDAIHITKALGVRYLWIDSLCIIQDSEEDWLHEAAAMSTVYSFSYCNIAALDAADSHGGCFFERDPSRVDIENLEVQHPQGQGSREYEVSTHTDWVGTLEQSPLYHRAWVLQERILPPRTLLYGKHQILWECRSHAACETFPSGVPEEIKPYAVFHSKQMLTKPDLASPREKFWDDVVERYSCGNLTHLSDKLVAISGIASVYGPADDYLAGVWRKTLLPDLLWHVPELKQFNGQPSVRPADYRAPSWSWASVEGEISYMHRHTKQIIARVLDAQTTSLLPPTASGKLTAEDRAKSKFSKVTAGYIQISGLFGEACLIKKKENKQLFFIMSKISPQSRNADPSQVEHLKQKLNDASIWLDEYHHARPPPRVLYWILVSTEKGLVLCRSHQGSYQRLGMFVVKELDAVQFENIPHATIEVV